MTSKIMPFLRGLVGHVGWGNEEGGQTFCYVRLGRGG
jgi:hypothetical protein